MSLKLVDVVVLALLLALGGAAFGTVFTGSGYLVAAAFAIAASLAIAYASAHFRWKTLPTTAIAVVALFVLSAAATRSPSAIGGVFPSTGSLRDFSAAIVHSWKQLLTANPPVTAEAGLLTVPYVTIFGCGLIAALVALRFPRSHARPLSIVPALTPLVVAISFGTRDTSYPLAIGGLCLFVSVAWLAAQPGRSVVANSSKGVPRLAFAGAIVAVAALGGVAVAPLVTGDNRDVLRNHVVPPVEINEFITPLAGYREYLKDYRSATIMTVDGLAPGDRIRLAAMDGFDGMVYNVAASGNRDSDSGVFGRISQAGSSASDSALAVPTGRPVTYTVEVGDYADVWIPSPGTITSLSFESGRRDDLSAGLFYNPASGTAITTAGLEKSDRVEVRGELPGQASDGDLADAALADMSLPAAESLPSEVTALATDIAGKESTPIAKARALEAYLHREGFYSNGLEGQVRSRAGHNTDRISVLLSGDQMIGDDEQYAVAMALMASSLGMPARVVMGFEMPGDRNTITGDDVHAWVEIAFSGAGWIQFDPTPPKDRIPQQEAPKPKTSSDPLVAEPPQPPQDRVDLAVHSSPDQGADDDSSWTWLWRGLINVAILLAQAIGVIVLMALPFAAIVGAKLHRRKRRRDIADPTGRIAAGWREVEDAARDLGVKLKAGDTRKDVAAATAGVLPDSDFGSLAARADSLVFGPDVNDDHSAERFWVDVDERIAALRALMKPSAWWRAVLNIRSLVGGLSR